ncbi:MAG: glutaredoxin 3 [Burkholderiales bacterium]
MQPVKIYTSDWCPYCHRALDILKSVGVSELEEIRVDESPEHKKQMTEITGRRTVPQIFVGDTHVGGCDDLMALIERGGLQPLLDRA